MGKNSFYSILRVWAAIYLTVPILLCSCSLLQEAQNHLVNSKHENITLELPKWPEYLPELCSWKIELCDTNGTSTREISTPTQSNSLKIKVEKNKPLCITAQPIVKQTENKQSSFFKCAGAIYPYTNDNQSKLELTWEGGYAATLAKSIINSGKKADYSDYYIDEILMQFNWPRFVSLTPFNPWLLDSQQILEGITNNKFTATKLKVSGTISVPLDFPVFSSYVPENEAIITSAEKNQYFVTIKKNQQIVFALNEENFSKGVLIYGSSAKKISLEFISLPIYIEEI